jgi:hypothetical protein
MWNWIKRRELIARHLTPSGAPAAEQLLGMALRRVAKVPAKSPLHQYLANRYADSVVLTFSQIEDLLGGALPDTARVRDEWWTSTVADKSSCSDAWILAGRTARPNLQARTVAFERRAESVQDSRDGT